MARLVSLSVADPIDVWRAMGFRVEGTTAVVGGVRHELDAAGAGVVGWTLGEVEVDGDDLDGLPTRLSDDPLLPATTHPNGTTELDHVVVTTPNLQRTIAVFQDAGMLLRRVRRTGSPERPIEQAFFRLEGAILEVVGAPDGEGDGPARFYGLAFTVADLDATAAHLGDRLRPAKDAVQPGRRIATLDRAAGSSVSIAFMTPDERD